MTDDGADYEYTYDAFGRLVEVADRGSSDVLARYRYNGLGHRIAWQIDTDADGTLETTGSDDPWTYAFYDERWRLIATAVADGVSGGVSGAAPNAAPTELWLHHEAGLRGSGSSSYIDSVILRGRPASTAKPSADGTLNQRLYYMQNWRADVVLIAGANGSLEERIDYTAYCEPILERTADFNGDGDRLVSS